MSTMANQTSAFFRRAQLWGGMVESAVPVSFDDASNFRQVPDFQEIFVKEGQYVLTFEVLEYQRSIPINEPRAAAEHFFKDLAETNECPPEFAKEGYFEDLGVLTVKRGGTETPIYRCNFGGTQVVRRGRSETDQPEFIEVQMHLLRVPSVETEVLISYCQPRTIPPLSPNDFDRSLLHTVASNFVIKDWSLFGSSD